MNEEPKPKRYAKSGDTIECKLLSGPPLPSSLRCVVDTPESVAYANELIDSGRWYVVESEVSR